MEQKNYSEEIEKLYPAAASELKNFLNDYLKSYSEIENSTEELKNLEGFVKLYGEKVAECVVCLPKAKQNELRQQCLDEFKKEGLAKEFYETALNYANFPKEADASEFTKKIIAAYLALNQTKADSSFKNFIKPAKGSNEENVASPEFQNYLKNKKERVGKIK